MHATMVNELPPQTKGRIIRVGVIINTPELPELQTLLDERFASRTYYNAMYSPYYDCYVIEVFTAGTSKWAGIQHLAQAMKIGEDQVIAIGDEINDVEMLRGASLSFAMGNAVPSIQAQAKRVTGSQPECGVSQVIDQLLCGELEPKK
jgi:hydroxymethylpyrimidine pyrophosphatase-like HAD family hydrolase